MGMIINHASLFTGFGGFDIAADQMGWDNIFQCDINPFTKTIRQYYWPQTIQYDDIKTTDFSVHRGEIDILTGGFPCQPFSTAGQRRGASDDRYLWPQMCRAISEIQPPWVIGENVGGITSMAFDPSVSQVEVEATITGTDIHRTMEAESVIMRIVDDLEALGYEVQPIVIPACAVNAPHRRDRVWFIAYSESNRNNRASNVSSQKKWRSNYKTEQLIQRCSIRSITDSDTRIRPEYRLRTWWHLSKKRNKKERAHTNTSSDRRKWKTSGPETEIQKSKSRTSRILQNRSKRLRRHVADTYSIRQWKETNRTGKSRFPNQTRAHYDWSDFPTQSPVCSGDDGLSTRLHDITFSSWRRQSIEGYGNAVVPPLVLEIFKMIEAVDQ